MRKTPKNSDGRTSSEVDTTDELFAELRARYAKVLTEPVPPRLQALVERLRAMENKS